MKEKKDHKHRNSYVLRSLSSGRCIWCPESVTKDDLKEWSEQLGLPTRNRDKKQLCAAIDALSQQKNKDLDELLQERLPPGLRRMELEGEVVKEKLEQTAGQKIKEAKRLLKEAEEMKKLIEAMETKMEIEVEGPPRKRKEAEGRQYDLGLIAPGLLVTIIDDIALVEKFGLEAVNLDAVKTHGHTSDNEAVIIVREKQGSYRITFVGKVIDDRVIIYQFALPAGETYDKFDKYGNVFTDKHVYFTKYGRFVTNDKFDEVLQYLKKTDISLADFLNEYSIKMPAITTEKMIVIPQ